MTSLHSQTESIDWGALRNPIIDRERAVVAGSLPVSARDPAVVYHDGLFHCFYSAVERPEGRYFLYLDVQTSRDLARWSEPRRLTTSPLSFSSPGNLVRLPDRWLLVLQSYPVPPGERYGSEYSRLWWMESADLRQWSQPDLIQPQGAQVQWSDSRRQIDPYLVRHADRWWCFYKTSGSLGVLVSPDRVRWEEASPDRPVLSALDTPDGTTVENPCVVWDGSRWALFFAPCRAGRGIGLAYSDDLLHWRDVHYVDFPALPWAVGGPTAPFVMPFEGRWLMFFHGDRETPLSAALAVAWSGDLEHWTVP